MPEAILHHYQLSPYSEKIRLALGLKALSWRSVEILKIDCLLNDPAPVFCKLAPSGSECESKIAFPRMEQKRCCTENTAAMFARIGTVTDFTPEP